MDDHTARLLELARMNPDALSDDAWKKVGQALAVKAVTITGPAPEDSGWLRHPSGQLVFGPNAAELIRDAKSGSMGSSALYACWQTYTRHYADPPLRHWRGPLWDPDASEVVDPSPLADLFAMPSPYYTMLDLEGWVAGQQLLGGDGYLVKLRDGGGTIETNTTGRVVYLHPVSNAMMRPARDDKSPLLYTHYEIDQPIEADKPTLRIPIENVIHFRRGINPRNPARGVGVVEQIAREIGTDAEATICTEAVMRNLGFPGLMLSPKDATRQTGIDVDKVKAYVVASTTGTRRGEPLIFNQPTDLQQVAVNTQGLNLKHIWDHVESRIAAVTGIPAVLAGLAVGLSDANYATVDAMLEYLTKTVLMSAWRIDGERWTHSLRADFALGADDWLGYDWLGLAALSEDENARWTRVTALWSANGLTLADVAAMLDLPEPPPEAAGLRNADVAAMATMGVSATGPARTMPEALPAPEAAPKMLTLDVKARTVSPRVTEDDVDDAIAAWDRWARQHAPALVGMLG